MRLSKYDLLELMLFDLWIHVSEDYGAEAAYWMVYIK